MENLPDKIPYIKGDYREGFQVEGLERQMKFHWSCHIHQSMKDVSYLRLDTMTISNIFPFGPQLGLVTSMVDPTPMSWIHVSLLC